MAAELWIVRHGETEWSASGRHTSTTDLPLTETGREQASRAAHALAGVGFAAVLCSPRRRARETCRQCGFAEAAETEEALREWDYGAYEGLTSEQIHDRDPDWSLWRDGCPNGESPEQVGARVDGLLVSIAAVDGTVLAFAHGHVLRVLAARWCGLEVAAGAHFALGTARIGVLGHEHDVRVIDRWSI